jgi:L-arabinokinase
MTGSEPIAYYVSSHGHGHAARSCDIIAAFNRQRPDVPAIVVSSVPEPFFRGRLSSEANRFRRRSFDAGVVQSDALSVDLAGTRAALGRLIEAAPRRIEAEAEFLRRHRVRLVVSDIPAVPMQAAARAGVPAIAVGNFSWNWIYEQLDDGAPEWAAAARAYREGYAAADRLLRLPFHEPMDAFARIEDLPLVATPGRARRREIAQAARCRDDGIWVLIGFNSLAWDADALDRLDAIPRCVFLSFHPLRWLRRNFRAIDRQAFPFSDVLASCDIVLTKPGFGIVSECIVNDKPMVYARRESFPEQQILERAIRRHARAVAVPTGDLYAGRLAEAIEAAPALPAPPGSIPRGGAEVAARRLAAAADARPPTAGAADACRDARVRPPARRTRP